jgi:hypothetical protein
VIGSAGDRVACDRPIGGSRDRSADRAIESAARAIESAARAIESADRTIDRRIGGSPDLKQLDHPLTRSPDDPIDAG